MQMSLDADKIIATVDVLAQRVAERFPDAGLEPTASSPTRTMNRIEQQRYLDYCSEVLSTNLTGKIWQKIMIIRGIHADIEIAQNDV